MKVKMFLAAAGLALGGCTQMHTSCVARGSRVLTPKGWRNIETLEIGDDVISIDEITGDREISRITHIQSATREVGQVVVGDRTLRMTSDHPVYDPDAKTYAPAGDWFLADRNALYVVQEDAVVAKTVDRRSTFVEITEVFDITVASELHNFVAEGILVHNKSIAESCDDINGESHFSGEDCQIEGCTQAWYSCVTSTTEEPDVAECACHDENQNNDAGEDTGNQTRDSGVISDVN